MRRILTLTLGVLRVAVAGLLLWLALEWRSPLFASIRAPAFAALILVPVALIVLETVMGRRRAKWWPAILMGAATAIVAALALGTTLLTDLHFHWLRYQVLHADAAQVERLGRHFIVGYRNDTTQLRDLIERRAIGGIFITAHNVRDKDADAVRREIDGFQAIRRRQGLPPLLIATDQEGGAISRMSPPLARPTTLGDIVRSHSDTAERQNAVRVYADEVRLGAVSVSHA